MHVKEIYVIFIHLFDSGILPSVLLMEEIGENHDLRQVTDNRFLFYDNNNNADLSFSHNKLLFFSLIENTGLLTLKWNHLTRKPTRKPLPPLEFDEC
jgi:hypothetical protein